MQSIEAILDFFSRLFAGANSLSWPLVVLLLLLFFRRAVWDLSTALVNVSQRVRRLGDIDFQEQEPGQVVAAPDAAEAALADVVDNDPDLQPWMENAEQILQQANIPANQVRARLIRAWAFANRARSFDDIGRVIFRTQVAALRRIAQSGVDGRGLRRFHREHVWDCRLRSICERIAYLRAH